MPATSIPSMPDLSLLETLPTHVIVQELQRRHRVLGAPFRQFVILGPPGSGKSTLADHFRYNFGYCSLLPTEADTSISNTEEKLEKIGAKVNSEVAKKGFVLDGFPNNVLEAKGLYETLEQKRLEAERKTGKWVNTETHKSKATGEFEKTAKISQLDACIMLDVADVEQLKPRLVTNEQKEAMTEEQLSSFRQDQELVAKYLEKTMNVRCQRLDAGLPKDQVALAASKLVLKGEIDSGEASSTAAGA